MEPDFSASTGVFGISVASQMVGTGVQNLRLYERRGLVEPTRTPGGTRLYSQNDVDRIRRIVSLLNDDGLNLAGVAMVLQLEQRIDELEATKNSASRGSTV
ncbi:MAG TPA: MerR family transcriptional regulator [Aeromicrobium sp.]|nr:MerR family transcriptional regulator [Aeromicrobium sp.]